MPRTRKPQKPYADFPLTYHAGSGQWCKKVRNIVTGKSKIFYFGKDAAAAAERWKNEKDDLHLGRTPALRVEKTSEPGGNPRTVRGTINRFLTAKKARFEQGKLNLRTFGQYKQGCALFLEHFGADRLIEDLQPADFTGYAAAIATVTKGRHKGRKRGLANMDLHIVIARSICLFAYDQGFIENPVRFGKEFRQSSKDEKRKNKQAVRARHGKRMFEPEEIRAVLAEAKPPYKAMFLLGINCGFGAMDIACLPRTAINLKRGWIDFPRPKTGAARTCPLWPETLAALKEALPARPATKDPENEHLAFLTKFGTRWVRASTTEGDGEDVILVNDQIGGQFNRILRRLGIKRPKLAFYAIRHTFQTVADGARDPVAVSHIMGHVDHSMGGNYREQAPADERLKSVVDVVRTWLFGDCEPASPAKVKSAKRNGKI